LYPFRSENEYELFEEDFTKICKKVTPFKVILKNFNFFQHQKQHYTIWIQPEPIESIINLQNLLLNVVPDCNDVNLHEFGFVPHLSVGQIIGKTQVISLLKELNQKWNELSFLLDNIFFIARKWVKNSKFEVKKQISLGKIIK
jgi:2'-5' RNA ligase